MTVHQLNEFRQDLVSGHWILISPGRASRPGAERKREKLNPAKEDCPFENQTTLGEPIIVYSQGQRLDTGKDDWQSRWTTQIVPNKYPALHHGPCGESHKYGPFTVFDADGFHELLITRDHDKSFAQFTQEETSEVLRAYRERYLEIAAKESADYILIFHNHGYAAGASVYHNHSQIIAMPIFPTEVAESIRGSARYYDEHGQRVHEIMVAWEIAEGKRIVYENQKFVVFCPFASKTPYEMRIFPKIGYPHFEEIPDEDIPLLADALNTVLKKINVALDDVDYNFYIHTAPKRNDPTGSHKFYGWHIELVPRLTRLAGFELGTAIFINQVDPDVAAKLLRETNV